MKISMEGTSSGNAAGDEHHNTAEIEGNENSQDQIDEEEVQSNS